MLRNVFALLILFVSVRGDCGIVTKKEWNGMTPMNVDYLSRPVDLVIIQHTFTPTCEIDERCAETVRSIQSNHMENLRYSDIAFSFLVGGNGKVYEGTGWLHVGSHTYGYNNRSIGIAFIGNYNNGYISYIFRSEDVIIKCPNHFWSFIKSNKNGSNSLTSTIYCNGQSTNTALFSLLRPKRTLPLLFGEPPLFGGLKRAKIAQNDTPATRSIEAVKALLQCGVENGHLSPQYHLVVQSQLIPTLNPGLIMFNEIRSWPHWLENVSSIKN